MPHNLFGRRKIYSSVANITTANVVDVLNLALASHYSNVAEEDTLFWYRRGKQDILQRQKEIRPEICSKIVVNKADEIVTFKNGYFLTKPTFYVNGTSGKVANSNLKIANEYLEKSGKYDADNEIVDNFHTMGVGVMFVKINDADSTQPVMAYSLDPRQSFVVYSRNVGNEPVMGVNIAIVDETKENVKVVYDVYTKDFIYHIEGGTTVKANDSHNFTPTIFGMADKIIAHETNILGEIPIIEYCYNSNRLGSFENVIELLDALNDIQSNRQDGIAQFIASLMVFYNCQLGVDENGNDITPQKIREYGAIFLKSVGQDKADLKILNEQLDQTQTQTLVNDINKAICEIAGVPFISDAGTSDSSNNGAVYLRNGWQTADTFARNTEDLFKKSNRYFDRIFFKILSLRGIVDIDPLDVTIQFTRNEMENLLVKTQGALNLKQLGLAPEIVLEKSGVSNDPIGDVAKSKKYIDKAYSTEEPKINVLTDATEETGKGNDDNTRTGSDKDNRSDTE